MNWGLNLLRGKFSNRVNVRAPIQFGRESQLHHHTKWIFLKNRPIHFYINRTSVIKLIKWNKLSPSSIEINKALQSSPFDACDRAHASTRTTSLMRVKNSTCHLCLWHLLSGTWQQRKWKREQTHQI